MRLSCRIILLACIVIGCAGRRQEEQNSVDAIKTSAAAAETRCRMTLQAADPWAARQACYGLLTGDASSERELAQGLERVFAAAIEEALRRRDPKAEELVRTYDTLEIKDSRRLAKWEAILRERAAAEGRKLDFHPPPPKQARPIDVAIAAAWGNVYEQCSLTSALLKRFQTHVAYRHQLTPGVQSEDILIIEGYLDNDVHDVNAGFEQIENALSVARRSNTAAGYAPSKSPPEVSECFANLAKIVHTTIRDFRITHEQWPELHMMAKALGH